MPLTQLAPPYPIFTDKNGDPLDAGFLYFGEVNQNPETNPIQVFYDAALTQPVAQPLRTSNGYVMRNGSPALIYAGTEASVTVRDKKGRLVIYSPAGYGFDPLSVSANDITVTDHSGDGVTASFAMDASPATILATTVFVDGLYQEKNTYTISGPTLTFNTPPANGTSIEIVVTQSAEINGAGAQQITYDQGGVGAVQRTVKSRLQDFVSVKDFGAVGDGVADDTAAVQALFSYASLNSAVGVLNPGTYRLTSPISISGGNPFTIFADQAKFVRSADYGTVVSINNTNGWVIDGLEIDAGFSSFPTNANHGIIWFNCSEIRVVNCKVSNYKNSGIIGYTSPESLAYFDNQVINCVVDGLNNANNGILLATIFRSGLTNCNALNIGKTGSPCYALQLKNGCQEGWIKGGIASGASVGVAAGNFGPIEHRKNIISGVNIFDCETGIAFGNAKGNLFSDLVIDMNNQGQNAVDLNTDSVGCVGQNIAVYNLSANKHAVNFRAGDTDNVVELASISNNTGLVRRVAQFLSGSERNTAQLDRYVNPTTVDSQTVLVTNLSGVSTNRFDYGALPLRNDYVIASDAITLFGPSDNALRLDTEGAAATDDLVTINGGSDGQNITIKTSNNLRDITVVHSSSGTNTIRLNGQVNFTLDGIADKLVLQYDGQIQQWCEVGRGG